MRILFVHQNFPGQFVHLAPALAARGHEVMALTAEGNPRPSPVKVVRYRLKPRSFDMATFRLAKTFADVSSRGEAVAQAAQALRDKTGYRPDVVFGHMGWGETLFLKAVWPDARLLAYAEFFYRPLGLDTGFDPEMAKVDLAQALWITSRQAHMLLAMNAADHGDLADAMAGADVSSRVAEAHQRRPRRHRYQRDPPGQRRLGDFARCRRTFPAGRRDLDLHQPQPGALSGLPHVHAGAARGDGGTEKSARRHHRRRRPQLRHAAAQGPDWKDIYLDEVKDRLDLTRVHFAGTVPHATFLDLMRVTRVHAYLTVPFVLSWSMLEAMAAGALVVGSRTPPVEEVIEDGVNGRLVDFFDAGKWSQTLIETLSEPERYAGLRTAARDTIRSRYDLTSVCLPKLIDLVEGAT